MHLSLQKIHLCTKDRRKDYTISIAVPNFFLVLFILVQQIICSILCSVNIRSNTTAVMSHIITFWSTANCIYDSSPVKLPSCYNLLDQIFTVFSMFRHTNVYHFVTTAYSIQYSNIMYRFVPRSNRLHHMV